jgi:hypothetical protein
MYENIRTFAVTIVDLARRIPVPVPAERPRRPDGTDRAYHA